MVMFSVSEYEDAQTLCAICWPFFGLKPSHVLVFCVFVPAEFTGFRIRRFCSKKDGGSMKVPLFCFGSVVTLVEMNLRILRLLQDASVLLAYAWAVAAQGDLDQKVSTIAYVIYIMLWYFKRILCHFCETISSQTVPRVALGFEHTFNFAFFCCN